MTFDEIARKNCPHRDRDRTHERGCYVCENASRLAQVAVEALEEHQRTCTSICVEKFQCLACPNCQSDILRRTQEIYEKGK